MVQNLKSTKEYMVKNKSLLPIPPDSISSNPCYQFFAVSFISSPT